MSVISLSQNILSQHKVRSVLDHPMLFYLSWQEYLPYSIEDKEGVVELGFFWVVLEGEEDGVTEPEPADETHGDQTISSWTLI